MIRYYTKLLLIQYSVVIRKKESSLNTIDKIISMFKIANNSKINYSYFNNVKFFSLVVDIINLNGKTTYVANYLLLNENLTEIF